MTPTTPPAAGADLTPRPRRARHARAGCGAKLEVIEVGLATGQIDVAQATTEYLRRVEEAAFLQGS